MDNMGIWVVILILAYAVLRLWLWTEKRLKQHVVHIDKLLIQVEHLKENVFEEEMKEEKRIREEVVQPWHIWDKLNNKDK